MIGRTIGQYKITDKLGEGGMGSVYKAVDGMVNRPVAIKLLHQYTSREAPVIERFRSEASLLAKLHHPNIATLFTFFCEDGEFFMVMEFVGGVTLSSLVRDRGPVAPAEAVRLIIQVLNGLEHAHQFGVFHRDIKPANILVTESGEVKITDFGIARAFGTERLTRDARLVGTIEYLAPERIMGQEGDERSDLYAVGVLLYELLTNRVPFEHNTDFELMRAHLEQLPPPLHLSSSGVPEALDRVVMRALAKQPEDRFATASEMRNALFALVAAPAVQVISAPTARPAKPPLIHRFASIAIAGVAVAILVALLLIRHRNPALNPPRPSLPAPALHALPVVSSAGNDHEPATLPASKPVLTHRPRKSPQTLREVHNLYIAKMPNGLDSYLRASISRKLAGTLIVVLNRSNADAILQNPDSRAPEVVSIVDIAGSKLLWSGAASDKQRLYLNLKHGGPRELAEKLTAQLKKALN